MDPKATLAKILDRNAGRASRLEAFVDLLEWKDRGGFCPGESWDKVILQAREALKV